MKKLLIILSIFMVGNINAVSAQVVLPSLDPTNPVEIAAAASWRFGSTIGGGGKGGTQKSDGEQVDSNTLANLSDTAPVNSSYIFAYQPTTVTFEVSAIANETEYQWDGSDSTTDHLTEYENNEVHVKIAIRGNNLVSVGIEYQSVSKKDASTDTQLTAYGGSFGMRFFDNIFIAGGLNRKTLASDEFESDLKWQEMIAGVALQFGSPDQSMLKLEGALKIEDAADVELKDGISSYYSPKTTTTQGSVEMILGGLLLSYQYKNILYEAIEDIPLDEDREEIRSRVGLGYRSTILTLVFYGENRVEKEDTNTYTTQYLGFNLSLSFM